MARREPTEAVLLDALGTLVRLEPPAPRLAARLGVPVRDAGRAVAAEIAYYRANLQRGRDAAGLAAVRRECAEMVRRELGLDAPVERVEEDLLASLEFTPFEDAVEALERWRRDGKRLVVVSNWDVSLHEVLDVTGLRPLVDGVVASAELGWAKPDPRPVRRALELAGVPAGRAVLVGDSPEEDVGAARAAGVEPVLIDRDGSLSAVDGVRVITSLADLTPNPE